VFYSSEQLGGQSKCQEGIFEPIYIYIYMYYTLLAEMFKLTETEIGTENQHC